MKFIPLSALLMFTTFITSAQEKDPYDDLHPLPSKAFDLMIVQDITYAITGEATPTSGIKIDITKPEGTISGAFRPNKEWVPWSLLSFDFKGGVSDRNFSLFKGFSNVNSAYELKPSFHFIPALSGAKYGYKPMSTRNKLVVYAKNQLVVASAIRTVDSFKVISMIRQHHLAAIDNVGKPSKKRKKMPVVAPATDDTAHRKIAIYFIKKILRDEHLQLDEGWPIDTIINALPQVVLNTPKDGDEIMKGYFDDVSVLYKKYDKLTQNIDLDTLNKMIGNASEIWTKKSYFWWTVSPYVRTEKVNEYYDKFEGEDSSYFKSDYRLYYGVSGYVNWYCLYPDKIAHLFRGSLTLSRSNNLTALSSYNYETRNPFYAYGASVTEKTKTGSAYNHEDIKTGFLKQLAVEYYLLPLKSLIPGVFVSANVNQSTLYHLTTVKGRENDEWQVGLEGGLVFNINSREKDKEKSILSILAYIRHDDLTDSRRTSLKTGLEESRDDFVKRNISIGLRIGIPINLPQRAN